MVKMGQSSKTKTILGLKLSTNEDQRSSLANFSRQALQEHQVLEGAHLILLLWYIFYLLEKLTWNFSMFITLTHTTLLLLILPLGKFIRVTSDW